ncbi:hypothetical protein FIV41_32715 [Pseudomonas marginalis]|uniref:Uncharacterized protein n=1 Tax=Pseudomonas marginalis TaxID=298 RepID=A0A9X9FU54_PSEMA|nr:hypothetical protein [Pseudomonas sp. JV449]MDT9631608.1 hypothetical protein [Pseudomonas sp. JV449]TKJ75818.1 hypothetical protein PspCFBP13509_25295 [Pseudomonas sp. CFBP13509]TWR46519.1 hypothetical protein FIV41_32715 [Pseudomonas marginalis]
MLAKNLNDHAGNLTPSAARSFFASKLAPTNEKTRRSGFFYNGIKPTVQPTACSVGARRRPGP